jgi:hypothetical protein
MSSRVGISPTVPRSSLRLDLALSLSLGSLTLGTCLLSTLPCLDLELTISLLTSLFTCASLSRRGVLHGSQDPHIRPLQRPGTAHSRHRTCDPDLSQRTECGRDGNMHHMLLCEQGPLQWHCNINGTVTALLTPTPTPLDRDLDDPLPAGPGADRDEGERPRDRPPAHALEGHTGHCSTVNHNPITLMYAYPLLCMCEGLMADPVPTSACGRTVR